MLSLDKEIPELSFLLPETEGGEGKQKGCLDCKQDFSKLCQRYKVLFSIRNFLQAKPTVIFVLALMFSIPERSSYTGIRSSSPFQPIRKEHHLISRNTIFNTESSYMCSTFNSSVHPYSVRIANYNSIRVAILPKLVTFFEKL